VSQNLDGKITSGRDIQLQEDIDKQCLSMSSSANKPSTSSPQLTTSSLSLTTVRAIQVGGRQGLPGPEFKIEDKQIPLILYWYNQISLY
jgi:hypothetical protein